MKNVKFGDILSVTSGIIVHGCNAQGVMGSGLAFQIKEKYPEAFNAYIRAYQKGLTLGDVILAQVDDDLYIANCITQQNYGRDKSVRYVSYKAIERAFNTVKECALFSAEQMWPLEVHYPLIGAGLANGDWAIISDIIESVFDDGSVPRTLWVQD